MRVACCCLLLLLVLPAGCATPEGPEQLTISAAQYEQAFEAAVEVARTERMEATFRDIRAGVIETGPARAASWLEP